MKCRPGCGACCIAPSISSSIPGMSDGKTAGIPCANLDPRTLLCRIWECPDYPAVCRNFTPSPDFCGETREEAMRIIEAIEKATGS